MVLLNILLKKLKMIKTKLMKQKDVYPYHYMNSFNRFSEKKLPNEDDFYKILNDEHTHENMSKNRFREIS